MLNFSFFKSKTCRPPLEEGTADKKITWRNATKLLQRQIFPVFFLVRHLSNTTRKIQINNTELYTPAYPFLSMRGTENNFICCQDSPIVFTQFSEDKKYLTYADSLQVLFDPQLLQLEDDGRLYHQINISADGTCPFRSLLNSVQ